MAIAMNNFIADFVDMDVSPLFHKNAGDATTKRNQGGGVW
jgi:hypothetical protein